MAETASSPAPKNPWRRYGLMALGLVVVGVVFVLVFLPDIRINMWIGQLHSDQVPVRREARDQLAASTRSGLDEKLEAFLRDPSESFFTRTQVGAVLIRRGRLPLVEAAARDSDLDVRTAALASLSAHATKVGNEWFKTEIVQNPEYRVKETILAWLGRKGDVTRQQAVEITSKIGLEEAVPLLRELTKPERGGKLSAAERQMLVGAAKALVQFGDCETLPSYAEVVKSSEDDIVQLRLMQAMHMATRSPAARCRDAVPEDVVKQVVIGALDLSSNPKHGALLILKGEPAWSREITDRLLSILDGNEGDTPHLRRAAIEPLVASGDEAFLRRLPRYFHDPEAVIRSQTTTVTRDLARVPDHPMRYESGWIGLLENETTSKAAFDAAAGGLRESAGAFVGLPEEVLKVERGADGRPVTDRRTKEQGFRKEMYERGESYGLSRADWVKSWRKWWDEKLGLDAEGHARAEAVRARFREAKAKGDVDAARKALEEATERPEGLFTYEEGWLLTQD